MLFQSAEVKHRIHITAHSAAYCREHEKGLFISMKTESDNVFRSQALKLTATQPVLANKM